MLLNNIQPTNQPEIKQGAIQQYITDNFSGVSFEHASDNLLLNRHILYTYLEICCSLAEIEEVVNRHQNT